MLFRRIVLKFHQKVVASKTINSTTIMPPSNRKRTLSTICEDDSHVTDIVEKALLNAGISQTRTKGGWCLKEGLLHICLVDGGRLLPLVEQHGPPTYYHSLKHCRHENSATENMKAPSTAFQSLCRIVAGQQLAGAAAQAVWKRLLETTQDNLTPTTILSLVENEGLVDRLQKPAGLSLAKAKSIVDLAQHFVRGDLSEESFLLSSSSSESSVRESLLQVKGLGPWSCDMFLMFTLEKSNILPVGDLGVRKGLSRHFSLRGSAKQGSLCPKKDLHLIQTTAQAFEPYQSLLSFYMWKAADVVDPFQSPKKKIAHE
jgi:3-methyladenine DNA glycosylase/8-oxoguanine DNA glycosylase